MIIIGEKLNSSIPRTLSALDNDNEQELITLIQKQEQAGADYLDVNTALCRGGELEKLQWVVSLICENSSCGIALDSPSPAVIATVSKTISGRSLMLNSVTLAERIDELGPLAAELGCAIVGLPIDSAAMPATPEKRVENAEKLVEKLTGYGVSPDKIFIDILAETISVNSGNGRTALETILHMKKALPSVKTTCGLSNISFGLPNRIEINCAFLSAALYAGLDSAILDPSSPRIRAALAAANALSGNDEYCMDYITAMRELQP